MKKIFLTVLLMVELNLLALSSGPAVIETSNSSVEPKVWEFCDGDECVMMALTVDVRNPSFKKYNKLILFTSNPSHNSDLMISTARELGFETSSSHSLMSFSPRLISKDQYEV